MAPYTLRTLSHPFHTTETRRPLTRRLLRWTLAIAGVLLFADFVLLPLGIALYAAWPANAEVGPPPDGFGEIDVLAADGLRLSAWYMPTRNGAAVVLLPGAGGTRESLRGPAALLAGEGFGVLALDPRGHGESDGATNRFAWDGSLDAGGAVTFLAAQPGVLAIGGWGISAGGETLLGAVGDYPQIRAVIADGATNRWSDERFALEAARGLPVQVHTWITDTFLALVTGDRPPTPMHESIANSDAALLLVAAGLVADEHDYAMVFADAAGDRAEVWTIADVGHTGGWGAYTVAYSRRALDFLTKTLVDSR